jgi:GTP cyclohydrolase IA
MKSVIQAENYFEPETITVSQIIDKAYVAARPIQAHQIDMDKVAAGIRLILEGIGEDPNRKGLLQTPSRVARMYQELFYGMGVDPAAEIINTFYEDTKELVLVKDIPFASVCEHHLIPFIGVAHVGYIPHMGQITGLSKLARVVELAARKLQVQERMTNQIADAIMQKLNPVGVVVALQAEHLCMSIRGIKKPGSKTVTLAVRGIIESDPSVRADVMARLWMGGNGGMTGG